MKYIGSLGAVPPVAAATQTSAQDINPKERYRDPVVVGRELGPAIEVEDTVAEVLQAGAGAIARPDRRGVPTDG